VKKGPVSLFSAVADTLALSPHDLFPNRETHPYGRVSDRRRAPKRAVGLLVSMKPLILGLFLCGPLISQRADFDVASIRPAGNGIAKPEMEFTPGGGVRATNVTLKMLIQMAYDIRDDQISGGPGWTDSETYTVVAKGSGGGTIASKTALQRLLRQRFHLELKRETNAAAGYVMAVGKSEPKIAVFVYHVRSPRSCCRASRTKG